VFTGAELTLTTLSGADISGADLRGALLAGADLSRAQLSNAAIDGANFYEARLDNARRDEIVRHRTRDRRNYWWERLRAKHSGAGARGSSRTADRGTAANYRSENDYRAGPHPRPRHRFTVWGKGLTHRQSEPRSRAGGHAGWREQASRVTDGPLTLNGACPEHPYAQ
jgi:Pentapeptide repeats (8 copies)